MKVAGALLLWVSSTGEHLGCVDASGDADVKVTVALEGPEQDSKALKNVLQMQTPPKKKAAPVPGPAPWGRLPASFTHERGSQQDRVSCGVCVCKAGAGLGSKLARGDGLRKRGRTHCALQCCG